MLVRRAKDFKDYSGGSNHYIQIKVGMSSEILRRFQTPKKRAQYWECKATLKKELLGTNHYDLPTNHIPTMRAILESDGWDVVEIYDIKEQVNDAQ